ncbi:LacI family DNA-binding transcriptional regulator [Schaalia sp. ZJ405]|uniref:LacI family DNA-binding transcriptional regulator n=1 Tax=unclassified Schaalia TaxID=2691889 RepID=UPI0013EB13EB|nr:MULTISPECIES: LacI family DNA-binding transcriptional regulator [unclassified Schaalia]QPK81755.1 LacI family DNA-binding transcriptional regulator [Schaalia sp. ZJ405]
MPQLTVELEASVLQGSEPPVNDHQQESAPQEATAAEVARIVGVSRASVSYALNGKPGVSAPVRARILHVAQELGIPIPTQATTETTTTPLIGVVLADLRNPYYHELGVVISREARSHGFDSYLAHTGDEPAELLTTVRAMANHNVDGIILTATQDGDATVVQELHQSGLPYVQVSRKIPTVRAPFVGIDNRSAARDMVLHLVDHGYRDIALVMGPRRSSASNERYSGYLDGLVENGIFVPRHWIVRTTLGTDGGLRAAEYLLTCGASLPEVVVCGSDAIAFGVIQYFADHGIRVPRDVAITGFDGLNLVGSVSTQLTTVVQPLEEMAQKAVEYVADLLNNKRSPVRDVICHYHLRIGTSCRCTPGKEKLSVK